MGVLYDTFNYVDDFIDAYSKYNNSVSREALEMFYSYVALETNETIFLNDIEIIEFLNDDLIVNIDDLLQHFNIDLDDLGDEEDDKNDTSLLLELIHDYLNNDGYELRHMDNNDNFIVFNEL